MNIQGMGPGMMGMMGMGGMQQSNTLTSDQKDTISSILKKFDSNNLTSSDAQSIFKQLQDAGINPGKGVTDALKSAGFDPKKLGELAFQGNQGQGMQGMMPPMMGMDGSQSTQLTDDQKKTVTSILDKYKDKADNLTTSDVQSIFKQFQDAGITPSKSLKDTVESAGFDLDKMVSSMVSQNNSSENLFWASQNTNKTFNTSNLQTLKSILDQYDLNNLSSDQQTNLFSQLSNSGLLQTDTQSGNYFNMGA
jgi:hypothetical protein